MQTRWPTFGMTDFGTARLKAILYPPCEPERACGLHLMRAMSSHARHWDLRIKDGGKHHYWCGPSRCGNFNPIRSNWLQAVCGVERHLEGRVGARMFQNR